MKKAVEKILEKIKRDKKIAAIVCVGLAGIIIKLEVSSPL